MKIWLTSSKDIEELLDKTSIKRFINTSNSSSFDIFSNNYNELGYITLGTFYYDIYLSYFEAFNKTCLKQPTAHKEGKIIDQNLFNEEFLKSKFVIKEEGSAFSSFKVWKLDSINPDESIFLTRCIPDKENYIKSFKNFGAANELNFRHYWLASYIETACRILEFNKVFNNNNIEINFLVHDSDVEEKKEVGCIKLKDFYKKSTFLNRKTKYFENVISTEVNIYFYQHSLQSFFYRNIITKTDFFDGVEKPATKLEKYVNLAARSEKFYSELGFDINKMQNE